MASTQQEFLEVVKPDISHIITEDDTPVDNLFSEKQQRLLIEPLYVSWNGPADSGRPFVAMANVGLFFMADNNPVVPDALVSLDVTLPDELWEKHHRSYFVWEYGKPPEVVIEIVSNRKGDEDNAKIQKYARAGIAYYVIFDPANHLSEQTLRVYEKHGIDYIERPDHWLPGLELGLILWEGDYEGHKDTWLRWCNLNDQVIATGAEAKAIATERAEKEHRRAEEERQRAEKEHQRAEEERQRAEKEHRRAERMAAKLRAMNIDPDEI